MSYGSLPYICFFLLFNALPESLVMTMAVFSILNLRLKAGKILPVALLQAASNLVMFLPISPGVHSIILVFTLAIYTYIFTSARLSKSFLAALICLAIAVLGEIACLEPLLRLTGLTLTAVRNNPFLISAFIVPSELVFLVLALAKDHYNRKRGLIVEA